MKFKEFNVKYSDEGNGSLEGYASTWIRKPDSYGDVVKEGAFTRTLEEKWSGGKGIPLLWAHKMDEIAAFIGTADAEEDEKGLHFTAAFDGTNEAQRVRELYKDGRLRKFSFAYDVKRAAKVTLEDGTRANELQDLELHEISCVCIPANDDAGVVGVKAAVIEEVEKEHPDGFPDELKTITTEGTVEEMAIGTEVESIEAEEPETKSGRRNSAKDADVIHQIITLAKSLLDDEVEPEEEDEPEANAAAEEQKASNSEDKEKLLAFIKSLEDCNESEE